MARVVACYQCGFVFRHVCFSLSVVFKSGQTISFSFACIAFADSFLFNVRFHLVFSDLLVISFSAIKAPTVESKKTIQNVCGFHVRLRHNEPPILQFGLGVDDAQRHQPKSGNSSTSNHSPQSLSFSTTRTPSKTAALPLSFTPRRIQGNAL